MRIYIHITPAIVNDTPQASHHQLVSWLATNDHVHEAAPMALRASFINICPAHRNTDCMIANRISFIVLVSFQYRRTGDVIGSVAYLPKHLVPSVHLFVKLQHQRRIDQA